jgi:RNase P/RNase MRP subunit POP5
MVRLKHRYIICQVLDDPNSKSTDYSSHDLQKSIREKVEALFGDVGVGSFGALSLIKVFDPHSKIFVMRTTREAETNLRLAISLVTSAKEAVIIVRTLTVAGSSRTCVKKLEDLFSIVVESSNMSDADKVQRRQYYTNVMSNIEV